MAETIIIDGPLTWREIASVADGARLSLSERTRQRIIDARRIVDALVERGIRGYGINTGVGALCNVVISRENQQALSHNIILSHACGVGDPLGQAEA
ncbi:MAG: aromatic amino acid lyase, partial [Sinorhizobium fredii]|nr:aromatic amino acid lyase [Sinorhizobium fredii]